MFLFFLLFVFLRFDYIINLLLKYKLRKGGGKRENVVFFLYNGMYYFYYVRVKYGCCY